MGDRESLLRSLPAISVLLENHVIKGLKDTYPHQIVTEAASDVIHAIRRSILEAERDLPKVPDIDAIIDLVKTNIFIKSRSNLRKVINATGIVLHTNLGRAVMAKKAVEAITEIAGSYSNLELDLTTGERGSRYSHVEDLLCRLTGAEAGMVVNNNAGAVFLVLSALASGREVVVSRGQLVEIGGSFRIPDVMAQSGAHLVEVGATNKTHLADYEKAVGDQTALLLKVHTSNYKIIGFTAEVSAGELVELGHKKCIPVYEDQGSGVLVDFNTYGIGHEPTVRESVNAGVDIVTCSGDKLFGGPQAGIILGKTELINTIRKHPLTRALRVDKFTLAALEATLRLYLDEKKAIQEIPTLHMITMPLADIKADADKMAGIISEINAHIEVSVVEGYSQVGGGALPEENIPTYLVSINPKGMTVNQLEKALRESEPPVLARIQRDSLLLDPRTLLNGDQEIIGRHLKSILG